MVNLSVDGRLLSAYIFYGSILLVKMMLMSLWTAKHRVINKSLPSPEDYGPKHKDKPRLTYHPDVERVRRAHLNDLENIPVFLILALLYMLANLPVTRGIWCLRIFTAARIIHTVAYLNAFSPPRHLGFAVGLICMVVLAVTILISSVKTHIF